MPQKTKSYPLQWDLFDIFLSTLFGKQTDEKPLSKSAHPAVPWKQALTNTDLHKTISLNGQTIEYLLKRTKRRSIGFLVNETGLRVTAPESSPLRSIEQAISKKQKWILSKLDYYHNKTQIVSPPNPWQNNTTLLFMGKSLSLHFKTGTTSSTAFEINNDHLIIYHPVNTHEPFNSTLLKKWLITQAKEHLLQRLNLHATQMGIAFKTFSLSNARQRWGSCSSKGNIRLNWRLIHCEINLIDYVVIHELAHLREMNHSQQFWTIVNTYCPEYKQARKQLHTLSSHLFSLF